MKIAINKFYGGFTLSQKALNLYALKKYADSNKASELHESGIKRNDPILIEVIEELGSEANGRHSKLKILDIPDDVKWQIEEYDGREWISEVHRTWH